MTFFYAISEVSHLHSFLFYYSKNQNDKPIATIHLHDSAKQKFIIFSIFRIPIFAAVTFPAGFEIASDGMNTLNAKKMARKLKLQKAVRQ